MLDIESEGLGFIESIMALLKLLQISRIFLNIICMKIVEYPRTIEYGRTI